MKDEKVLVLATAAAIAGILLLSYGGQYLTPPNSPTSAVAASNLGKLLLVRGNVTDLHQFEGGSAIATLTDEEGDALIYFPYNCATELALDQINGSIVEFAGTVDSYEGRIELNVENPGNVRILRR